jgi:NinB protein
MGRAMVLLKSDDDKARAIDWCRRAPAGTRIEFRGPRRSTPQNDRLWLMLDTVSKLEWHGQRYTPEEWKDYFMHAYRGEKWMPAEDGGMVPIGRSTSQLAKDEFGELMELIEAFCARQNIKLPWHDQAQAA